METSRAARLDAARFGDADADGAGPAVTPRGTFRVQQPMKPARRQVAVTKGPSRAQGGYQPGYNIWYDKFEGRQERKPAETRCCIRTDQGITRGTDDPNAWLCLKFARGCCSAGAECDRRHEVPTKGFAVQLEPGKDCFGRERHATDREDRGGVGCFNAEPETQRTLYVGGLPTLRDPAALQAAVRVAFTEWGEIEHLRLPVGKPIAFVRYRLRPCAELAKIAMAEQPLTAGRGGGTEMLNIRWATEDPNPGTQKRRKRRAEDAVLEVLARQEDEDGERQYQLPAQIVAKMQRAAAKKRKQQELQTGHTAAGAATGVVAAGAGTIAGEGVPKHPARPATPPAGLPLPAEWETRYDPSSSKWYYFNGGTGVSTWLRPRPAVALVAKKPATPTPAVSFAGLGDYGSSSDSD